MFSSAILKSYLLILTKSDNYPFFVCVMGKDWNTSHTYGVKAENDEIYLKYHGPLNNEIPTGREIYKSNFGKSQREELYPLFISI